MIRPADLTRPWRAHAAERPTAVALTELAPHRHTTWAELAACVDAWKARARAAGVGPGDRVVIRYPASRDWIALLWACWELDAVWCPLPPDVPHERAERQIAHADPRWVIGPDDERTRKPIEPPCDAPAAYLIYTSGSTGEPKGVLVGTEGVPQLWASQVEMFRMTSATVAGWMLSPAFDASVSDVGTALTVGARTVIVPKHHWRSHRAWQADMDREGITQLDAPPSWLALWTSKPRPATLATLIAGGEVTPAPVLQAWTPHVHWVNVYGPTEATVCTSAEVRHVGTGEDAPATLGQPFPGLTYRLQPVSVDAPSVPDVLDGELWIGGGAVALGYWRDPSRTQDRFATHAGQRWFRTGDRVRREGEAYVFVGRLDRQVKRRGQLIHLDEIESVLAVAAGGHPVVVFIDAHDRLIAAVPPGCPMPLASSWAQQLPTWGHPQAWFQPDTWPWGTTGKTDRHRLAQAWEQA